MFDETAYITPDEISRERTTAEFVDWTEHKLAYWAARKAPSGEGRELHERVILRRGLFGPFHEEVLPFCRYLQATNQVSSECRCSITLDSSLHYDATLDDNDGHHLFEITQAIEDRQDVRIEQLLTQGHVNAIGAMQISGTKRAGRTVLIDDDMVPHESILANLEALVIRRLERKTIKRTENQTYDPNTSLLIAADDYILDDEDHSHLHSVFSCSLVSQQSTFQSVIVIGFAGHLLLQFSRDS